MLPQGSKMGPLSGETVAHATSWKWPFSKPSSHLLGHSHIGQGYAARLYVPVKQVLPPTALAQEIFLIESINTHAGNSFKQISCTMVKTQVTVASSNWILSARRELRECKFIKIIVFDIGVDRETVSVSGSKGDKRVWEPLLCSRSLWCSWKLRPYAVAV